MTVFAFIMQTIMLLAVYNAAMRRSMHEKSQAWSFWMLPVFCNTEGPRIQLGSTCRCNKFLLGRQAITYRKQTKMEGNIHL